MQVHTKLIPTNLSQTSVQFGTLRDIFNSTSVKEVEAENKKLKTEIEYILAMQRNDSIGVHEALKALDLTPSGQESLSISGSPTDINKMGYQPTAINRSIRSVAPLVLQHLTSNGSKLTKESSTLAKKMFQIAHDYVQELIIRYADLKDILMRSGIEGLENDSYKLKLVESHKLSVET